MHTYVTSTHTAHAHTFHHVLQDLPLLCCVLALSDPLLELFSWMNTITDSLVGQRVTAHSKLHVIGKHWVSSTCMTSSSSYCIHIHCTAAYNLEVLYTLYTHIYNSNYTVVYSMVIVQPGNLKIMRDEIDSEQKRSWCESLQPLHSERFAYCALTIQHTWYN